MKMRWQNRKRFIRRAVCSATVLALAVGFIVTTPTLSHAAQSVDLNKPCSLTVNSSTSTDEEFKEDVATANVVIDLYKVADVEKVSGYDTYSYTNLGAYSSLDLSDVSSNKDWKEQAQIAAEIALGGQMATVSAQPAGSPVSVKPGLYLVIARGSDIEQYVKKLQIKGNDEDSSTETPEESIVTIAQSSLYEYTFLPELISLPNKTPVWDEETGEFTNNTAANYGEWVYDVSIAMKPERNLRFGSLEIIKTLRTYEATEPATFVFDVTATDDRTGETVFSNVYAIDFTAPGTQSVRAERIPAGAKVTVKEVYSGAVYEPVTPVTQDGLTISAEDVVSASFTNDYNTTNKGGGSITNHFDNRENEGWHWEGTRSDGISFSHNGTGGAE